MDMLNPKQKIILIIFVLLAAGVIFLQYINSTKDVYKEEENISLIEEQMEKTSSIENEEKIIVHVTGAVNKNGIVEVKENARINDVIEAAGGITKDADLTNVNLAYIVEDGQKIYIPSKDDQNFTEKINDKEKEIISDNAGESIIKNKSETDSIININKANLEKLKLLPGVGETTALKILEYRETHGKFKNIEELKNISGIGETKYNLIKNKICV